MTRQAKRDFCLSAALHLVALLGFGLLGLTNCSEELPKAHVFELVSPPSSTSVTATPPKPISLPTPPKPPSVEPPKPEPPRPAPPEPEPPKPATVVEPPKPKSSPKPKPKPKAESVSYEIFKDQNQLSDPKTKPTPRATVMAPTISDTVERPGLPEIQVPRGEDKLRNIQQRQAIEQDYLARVMARIEARWRHIKAQNPLVPLADAITMNRVRFGISPDGRVIRPKLVKHSGHKVFDALVLQTFRTIGNVGRPPYPVSKDPELNFTLE